MPTDQRDRERAARTWIGGRREWPTSVVEWVDGTREHPYDAATVLVPFADALAAVREEARREALEEAASECDRGRNGAVLGYARGLSDGAMMCSNRIRALIAKEPTGKATLHAQAAAMRTAIEDVLADGLTRAMLPITDPVAREYIDRWRKKLRASLDPVST